MLKYLVLAVLLLVPSKSFANEGVIIGAWNIQDFHHEEGISLRSFSGFHSVKRTQKSFQLLDKYKRLFGSNGSEADILALQEIGTKKALNKLFPPSEYETLMSPRWQNDEALEGKGDVYTAIAIRKNSGFKIIARADLPALAIAHKEDQQTRAGTGALLEREGKKLWFLSVHLKSSCPKTKNIHNSTNENCKTLWAQAPILSKWIKEKKDSGIPFIIAGDFNRQFRMLNDKYPLWKEINGVSPDGIILEPWLVKHPLTATRKCPTKKGKSLQPIDWFLLDVSLESSFNEGSYLETRFSDNDKKLAQGGAGLSDHCPISIRLKW